MFHHMRPRRLRALTLTAVTAALNLALVTVGIAVGPAPAAHAATTTWLPFDLPSSDTLQAASRKAFANWVPTMPLSIDNQPPATDYYQRNYLDPKGEKGKHAAYGGFLRDRPLGRNPLSTPSWRLEDMKTEVRNAIAAGLDGFTVVIYSFPAAGGTTQQWDNVKLMLQAAAEVDPDFKIILMPDMTATVGSVDANTMASRMAELGKSSAIYRINGKMVFSPFTAERKNASYWSSVKTAMANSYATPIEFFPLVQNETAYAPVFDPISYGLASWGDRDPTANRTTATGAIGRINAIQALGLKWMQPISVQDERPRSGKFAEAGNTENLRNTWEIARVAGAEFVQYNTWNDLPEGSGFLPSVNHGYSFLDISAYYLTWYKLGTAPKITRDAIYLTHRKQLRSAKVTFPQTLWMNSVMGSTAPRDTVEALTFSQSAGTVSITVGTTSYSCAVDAGVDTCTVPLGTGTVRASLIRNGTTTAMLTSPYPVTATPYVQDFQYVASSSLRNGTTASAGSAGATGSTVLTATTTADTTAEAATPTVVRGGESAVFTRGKPNSTAYLRFSVPAAPAGKTLISATLKVRTTPIYYAGSPHTYSVQTASDSWSESTVNWNNRPALGSTVLGSLSAPSPDTSYSSSLSVSAVQALLGKSATIALYSSTNTDGIYLCSRENSDPAKRAQLVLTFG